MTGRVGEYIGPGRGVRGWVDTCPHSRAKDVSVRVNI